MSLRKIKDIIFKLTSEDEEKYKLPDDVSWDVKSSNVVKVSSKQQPKKYRTSVEKLLREKGASNLKLRIVGSKIEISKAPKTPASAGLGYEKKIFSKLKKFGLINPSQSKPGTPVDIKIQVGNKKANVEVKSGVAVGDYVPYGSKALHFSGNSTSPWSFDSGSDSTFAQIRSRHNVIKLINERWYTHNQTYEPVQNDYDKDKENLSEFRIPIANEFIRKYYVEKKNHYIHLENKGLYYLGGSDPLGIKNKIPLFNPTDSYMRVRVAYKGNGKYVYLCSLHISRIKSSENCGFDTDSYDEINEVLT